MDKLYNIQQNNNITIQIYNYKIKLTIHFKNNSMSQ